MPNYNGILAIFYLYKKYKNTNSKLFFLLILFNLLFNFSAKASQWFCKEGASNKNDNTYEVCGIGFESSENESRKTALKNAFEEFNLICNNSDDCRNKYKQISPLRTDCEIIDNNYKCYRSFYIKIDPTKNISSFDYKKSFKESKINENNFINFTNLNYHEEETENLAAVEKISTEIRQNIKYKNQIVESYLKRGMSLKEVFKILNANSTTTKYTSLQDDDYLIYGTYKIQFNLLENSPILESVCDMDNAYRCLNIEP